MKEEAKKAIFKRAEQDRAVSGRAHLPQLGAAVAVLSGRTLRPLAAALTSIDMSAPDRDWRNGADCADGQAGRTAEQAGRPAGWSVSQRVVQ